MASFEEAKHEALSYTWKCEEDVVSKSDDEWEDIEDSGSDFDDALASEQIKTNAQTSKTSARDGTKEADHQPRGQEESTTEKDDSGMHPCETAAPAICVEKMAIPVMPNLAVALRH